MGAPRPVQRQAERQPFEFGHRQADPGKPADCGALHYLWLVKAGLREPFVYAIILAVLLVAWLPIVVKWMQSRRSKSAARCAGGPGLLTAYDARSVNPSRDAA